MTNSEGKFGPAWKFGPVWKFGPAWKSGPVWKFGPAWKILAAVGVVASLSSCGPLIGGAAVVAADEAAEQDGDGGLF